VDDDEYADDHVDAGAGGSADREERQSESGERGWDGDVQPADQQYRWDERGWDHGAGQPAGWTDVPLSGGCEQSEPRVCVRSRGKRGGVHGWNAGPGPERDDSDRGAD